MLVALILLLCAAFFVSTTLSCGMTVHAYNADKSRMYLENSEILGIIERHTGSFELGSGFPDYLYQCGTNHDNGEFAHWRPFQALLANHIRTFTKPWTAEQERFISFSYGVVSHAIADLRWHGLNEASETSPLLPFGSGFIRQLGGRNCDMDGNLGDPAHNIADTDGEFTVLKHSKIGFNPINVMDLPMAEVINIFASVGRHVNESSLIECGLLFGAVEWAEKNFISLIYPIVTSSLCPYKFCDMKNAPYLEQSIFSDPNGGIEDMAFYTAHEIERFMGWVNNGPPTEVQAPDSSLQLMRPSSGYSTFLHEVASLVDSSYSKTENGSVQFSFAAKPINNVIAQAETIAVERRLISTLEKKELSIPLSSRGYIGGQTTVCDLEGDGKFNDLIVAIPGDSKLTGMVLVYLNGDDSGNPHFTLKPSAENTQERFGSSLACIDWNHDGAMDIVIGSPTFGNVDGSQTGKVSIYSIKDLATPIFTALGSINNLLAYTLHVADIDLDGVDELITGSDYAYNPSKNDCGFDFSESASFDRSNCLPAEGSVTIFSHKKDSSDVKTTVLWGQQMYSGFGKSLTSVSYEGSTFLVVGAPSSFSEFGSVYLFNGSDILLSSSSLVPHAVIVGDKKMQQLGYSVSCTNDISFTGKTFMCAFSSPWSDETHAPTIFGIPTRSVRLHTGAVDILTDVNFRILFQASSSFVNPTKLTSILPLATLRGSQSRANFGFDVSFGSKLSNGYPSLFIGAPHTDVTLYLVDRHFTAGAMYAYCNLDSTVGEVGEADGKVASWTVTGEEYSKLGSTVSFSKENKTLYISSPSLNDMNGAVYQVVSNCN